MIADKLENLEKYVPMFPFAEEVLSFIKKTDLKSLPDGKIQVRFDEVFLLVQQYSTKPENEKKWESHGKYIDIQIVLSGSEHMGYCPASQLEVSESYNPDKDITFYRDAPGGTGAIHAPENTFCLFFPGEAHKPGISRDVPSEVKKAVFKVLA